jgi:hypothetical protein
MSHLSSTPKTIDARSIVPVQQLRIAQMRPAWRVLAISVRHRNRPGELEIGWDALRRP